MTEALEAIEEAQSRFCALESFGRYGNELIMPGAPYNFEDLIALAESAERAARVALVALRRARGLSPVQLPASDRESR